MTSRMSSLRAVVGVIITWIVATGFDSGLACAAGGRLALHDGWTLQSSVLVNEADEVVSTEKYTPQGWYSTCVPSTVLNTLINHGVYPDLRFGLNSFRIPDSSDDFNKKHDLSKYSHLPDQRNPWKDPYWYRTEFQLPKDAEGQRVWLNLQAINYRADVWVNGHKAGDRQSIVGAFQRFRLDISERVKPGRNVLAVKIYPVDHPANPWPQLEVFCKPRYHDQEIFKDVTFGLFAGYDCMLRVPDRNMGLWQEVFLEFAGPVSIRHPHVVTDLPLPDLSPARLTISAELANATSVPQKGLLTATIVEDGVSLQKNVELAPGQTTTVVFSDQDSVKPVIQKPRLWWPRNYGPQNLYHVTLRMDVDGKASDTQTVPFGVRKITKVLHKHNEAHGLQLHINGQKIFCRGGYIQPELLFAWDAKRMETEIRYFTEANLNLVYFEDIPNPPDVFLDLCDRYGLLFGNCFYGCSCATQKDHPLDFGLLRQSTVDIIKRYRNHPSLWLYMPMNEGTTRRDVYEMCRELTVQLDGTRIWIPSGYFSDTVKNPPEWIKKDMPVGMNDNPPKSYGWQEPAQYYRWVQNDPTWTFKMESGSASVPPVDSLRRFIPDLFEAPRGEHYPLTPTWAHFGANSYYQPYHAALRRMHGESDRVEDYCMKAHLVTADQHRAMFEAVNHRMWDITSGYTEWKINACMPDIQWQIFDWFLKPMVSYYYMKKACEPLHVQLSPLDRMVTLVNHRLEPKENLDVEARVYDFAMNLRWKKQLRCSVAANSYRELFAVEAIPDLTPVYFVKLEAREGGKLLSDNFYWLSSKEPIVFTDLATLPAVRLKTSSRVETSGDTTIVRAVVENPTEQLAFFIHLAAVRESDGDEIVPVFWDDNYFSLLPKESREVCARLSTKDLGGKPPVLQTSGWNVEDSFDCVRLAASKSSVQVGEAFAVTATIANTSLDGSRVALLLDGKPLDVKRVWARGDKSVAVSFSARLDQAGTHHLRIGDRELQVVVK